MGQRVAIVDYKMGNLMSVFKKLNSLDVEVIITDKESEILSCDKLVLPGIGHFGKAMEQINMLHLSEPIKSVALVKKKPVLGICLGMQLLSTFSEEGNCNGLELIPGKVKKFETSPSNDLYRVPHMGWNSLLLTQEDRMLIGIKEENEFYFSHSYYFEAQNDNHVIGNTHYRISFASMIRDNNIIGMQFHPEKSHVDGDTLIKNFILL